MTTAVQCRTLLIYPPCRYANNNLKLEGTLTGNGHELDDEVGMHMGIYAVYEYQSHPAGTSSKVRVQAMNLLGWVRVRKGVFVCLFALVLVCLYVSTRYPRSCDGTLPRD